MTVVTLPGGGTAVALTFSDPAALALAEQIASDLATASTSSALSVTTTQGGGGAIPAAGTIPGSVQELEFTGAGTGSPSVPAGYGYIVVANTGATTIKAAGGTLIGSASVGGITYLASGASTVALAGGNNFISVGGGLSDIATEGGADTISSSGSGTIQAGGGSNVVSVSGAGSFLISTGAGTSTIFGGSGASTVVASGNALFNTGGGSSVVILGASDSLTVQGGAATVTASGGNLISALAGGVVNFQGSGASTVVAGGATTVFGAAGSSVLLVDSKAGNTDFLVAGAGAEMLNGSSAQAALEIVGASGANQLIGGSGADTIFGTGGGSGGSATMTGGAGSNFFVVSSGNGKGGQVITDFTTSDGVFVGESNPSFTADFLLANASISGSGVTLTLDDGTHVTFTNLTSTAPLVGHIRTTSQIIGVAACFAPWTRILTDRGAVEIKKLREADRVLTVSGQYRPIVWIGHRAYDGRFVGGNRNILPVTISAGALADGVPGRDLVVSPLHAFLLEGVLIDAKELVNGTTITQADSVEAVAYYNLEFDTHDVIYAEGAAAETFVGDESRGLFANAAEYSALYPAADAQATEYYAPRLNHGEAVHRARNRIARRAGQAPERIASSAAHAPQGFVDRVTVDMVEGWIQCMDAPEDRVRVTILQDGERIGEALANRMRADLLAAGKGSGRHAFAFAAPAGVALRPGGIAVRRSLDGAILPSSSVAVAQAAA